MSPEEETLIRYEVACLNYVREPNEDALLFIQKQPFRILQLVETLQEHATSKEDECRSNAFLLLSKATTALEINDNEASCLVKFYAGRLSEKYNVLPVVLEALTLLVESREELSVATVGVLLGELFAEVDTQSFSKATRGRVYRLVQTLLQKHLITLMEEGTFLNGYLNLIDGEQDPENLSLVFSITVTVLQHFNIDTMREIVFEAVSCYYPIDYTAPPDEEESEGRVVTGDELKVKLNNCFKASASLAGLAVPFLVEKFGTSLLQTRMDSCVTLKACLMSYGVLCSPEHLNLVWNSLKNEIFGGVNDSLRAKCHDVVSAIFWVLTLPNVKNKDLDPSAFLDTVFTFCKTKLSYSEERYIEPTGSVLVAIVRSSGIASGLVAEQCLEWLVDTMLEREGIEDESHLPFLNIVVKLLGQMRCEPARATAALPHLNFSSLQEAFLRMVPSDNVEQVSCTMNGLHELLEFSLIATETESEDGTGLDVEGLILAVHGQLDTRTDPNGLALLTALSRSYPALANKLLLQQLLEKLEEGGQLSTCQMLSRLLVGPLLIEHAPRVLQLFTVHGDHSAIALITNALQYQESREAIKFCREFVFFQLLNFFKLLSTTDERDIEPALHAFNDFVAALFQNTLDTTPFDLGVVTEMMSESAALDIFDRNAKPNQKKLLLVFTSIVEFTLHREHSFDISSLLDRALGLLSGLSDTLVIDATTKLIGIILNRGPESSRERSVQIVMEALEKGLENIHAQVMLLMRTVQALVPLALSSPVLPLLLRSLSDPTTHTLLSEKCTLVLEPMFKGNRVLLYKQKFLLALVPLVTPLIQSRDLTESLRSSVVRGIGSILSTLPESLLSTEGASLTPILLSSLSASTADRQALRVVQFLVRSAPGTVILHLDSLIGRVLEVAAAGAAVETRVEALKTLEQLTRELHYTHTHVHRASVLRGLRKALDDRKRVVRGTAARTLDRWTMLEP